MRSIKSTLSVLSLAGGLLFASVAPGCSSSSRYAPSGPLGGPQLGAQRKATIENIQQALKDKGYDPGRFDGFMGPWTRKAIRDFQRDNNLRVTGMVDAKTAEKLGVSRADFIDVVIEQHEDRRAAE